VGSNPTISTKNKTMTQNQEFYFEVTVSWSQADCDYYIVKAYNKEEAKIIADNRFKNRNSHLPLISIGPNKFKLIS